MKQAIIIVILLLGSVSLFSQVKEGSDGRYLDKNNKPYSGIHKEYWANDKLKSEIPLNKGFKDGEVILYFENGSKNEIRAYKKGKMHGTWVTWDENGNKTAEANYLKGKKNGKWYIWDEKGILRYDMTYKKGDKTGNWFMWDEKGVLIMEKNHDKKK